jgi:hypothetical protein
MSRSLKIQSETVIDTIVYIGAGRQGPYTACQERPTKGGSNTARPPNIDGSLSGERNAGLDAPSKMASSRLPGWWGNTHPGVTTHRREISLWNCHAHQLLKGAGAVGRIVFHIYTPPTVNPPRSPVEGNGGVHPRVPSQQGLRASGCHAGPWGGGICMGREIGDLPPLVAV